MAWLLPCLFFFWIILALAVLPDKPHPRFLAWQPKHPQVVIVAGIVGLIGVYLRSQFPAPDGWVLGFLVDLAPELVGMAFTVVVIDELNQRRLDQQEKNQLFRQVKSPVRDIAVEALRLIRENDWLGEVVEKYKHNLRGVQWQGAGLLKANLQGVSLNGANLQEAKLNEANLQGAHLKEANLQGADLRFTNLYGTNLIRANLQGARYSKETIWPENFDPKQAGAIKVTWDKTILRWVPETDEDNDNSSHT